MTKDKELCYTHIETVKKTDIVIIATQSNNEPIAVWVKALIKSKGKIERLVKHTEKKGERPAVHGLVKTGTLLLTKTIEPVETDRVKARMKKTKPTKPPSDEYQRFEKLAKMILAVPKSELDKREAEYQREKKAAKKRKVA